MALFAALFAALAFQFHAGMRTNRSDLGQIAQAVWNSSRGRLLEQTDNGFLATRMTDHVEPILALISPVFWLWEDVRALLLLQALFVAAGAWPLYHLALRRLERALAPRERTLVWRREPLRAAARPLALALAIAYLLAPQTQSALLTEFHAVPLAVPLILWALWAIEARRWGQASAAILLVAAVKEEIALLAALLGFWMAWRAWASRGEGQGATANSRLPVLAGLALGLLALAWFAAATFVIVPRHALPLYGQAESLYFARYGALGDSPVDILRSLVTRPGLVWNILAEPARQIYLRDLLLPFGFLALLAPDLLLLSLPVLLANVLSAYPAQFYGEFHYSAPLVPYVAAAAAFGLGRLWGLLWRRTEGGSPAFQHMPAASAGTMAAAAFARNPRTALRPLLAGLLVLWIVGWGAAGYWQMGRGPGGGRYDPVPVHAHHRLLGSFVAQLPADAAVSATAAVHPHVALRRFVYQFPLGLDAPTPADERATWALLDVTANTDMAPSDLKQRVDDLLAQGWGVVNAADGVLLLAEEAPRREIPAAFYTFTETPDGAPTPAATADDWPRWRQTRIVADWPAWEPGTHILNGPPRLDVLTPNGDTVANLQTAAPPALVWRPASDWQPDRAHRVATLPLSLPRSSAVALGGPLLAQTPITVLRRIEGDRLVARPYAELLTNAYAQAIGALARGPLQQTTGEFQPPGAAPLRVTAWVEDAAPWLGDTVDLWLQWQGEEWPAGYVPFVHLRLEGLILAQQDGAPRLFGPPQQPPALGAGGFVNDWRTLPLPLQVADGAGDTGTWSVVVGLYDPESGARAPLATGGDELTVHHFRTRRAVPDQTCALIAATCAAQPAPYR